MKVEAAYLAIASVGFIGGSVTAYFGLRSYFEQVSADEIEQVKKIYNQKPDHKKFAEEMAKIELEAQRMVDEENAKDAPLNKPQPTQFGTYESLVRDEGYFGEETEDSSLEEDDKAKELKRRFGIITEEEFQIDCQEYNKVCLSYYPDSETITDDSDRVVDNVYKLFNPEALDHFGSDPMDPDVIHIRNDESTIDFEIVKCEGSPFS